MLDKPNAEKPTEQQYGNQLAVKNNSLIRIVDVTSEHNTKGTNNKNTKCATTKHRPGPNDFIGEEHSIGHF